MAYLMLDAIEVLGPVVGLSRCAADSNPL